MSQLLFKKLFCEIQGSFFSVYKSLRNAFKEKIYRRALKEELKERNLNFESEKRLNIYYRSIKVGIYVPDLIIENLVLVEIKAKPFLIEEDRKQFWFYLKGSEYRVGYLVNFGSAKKVEFLRRVYDQARKQSS